MVGLEGFDGQLLKKKWKSLSKLSVKYSNTKLDEILSVRTLFDYNVPALGVGFMFFLVSLYLMKFATDELLIAPAAMGFIFGLSRIWDAITDPVAGYYSDRTNTAMGRRRPWMISSVPFIFFAFIMIWSPPAGLERSFSGVWMAAAVILFYSAMTAFNVPHNSLGAELSPNYHQRTRVFGVRHMVWNSGALLALVAMHQLIVGEDPRGDAFYIAVMAGTITTVLIFWMVFRVRERKDYQGRGEKNPVVAFSDVIKNKHAVLLLVVFFIENLGGATIAILTPYISEYIILKPERTVFYILMYLIPSIISVPLWVSLSRKIGKKKTWLISMWITGLGFGGMFFLYPGADALISILAFVCGLGAASGAAVAPSIQSDVIDYDEYRTGKRKEGTYFSSWNLVFKTATGITFMITGFILSASGFVPNQEQTETAKFALLFLYAVFPFCCYISGAIIFSRFSLDEAEHMKIREKLDRTDLS